MRSKIYLFAFAFIIISTQLIAQHKSPTKENIDEILKKKLIVVLFDGGDNDKQLNEIYKKVVNEYWTFHKDIEFLTFNEAFEKTKVAKDDYVLLNSGWTEYSKTTSSGFNGTEFTSMKTSANSYSFSFDFLEQKIKKKKTDYWFETKYRLPTMNPAVNIADFTLVIKQLSYRFSSVINGTEIQDEEYNINSVTTRTLLIRDDIISFDKKEVDEYYKYPYKIVDANFINQAVKEKSSKYIYLTTTFSTGFMVPMFALVETDSQKIVSLVAPGGVKTPTLQIPSGTGMRTTTRKFDKSYRFKAKYFKYFASPSAQKLNYRE